ncbi:unnamed protein product [Closterium sp. NIES-53]
MHAVTDSAEGDYYVSVPPDLGIEAAAPGASESAAPGSGESAAPGTGESNLSSIAPTKALHTFTLDSGASRSFFRDSTTLTPLSRPVAVSLADPSGGPVLAHSSTVLPCPAAPLGLLSGLHLPSFSTHLVAASGQVFAAASRSSPASAPCLCCPLSHETLLWHHRLGHPSLPRLQGMASRTLGHERYFLLVVDDYSRYTTVFPLCRKGEVTEVLIDKIRGARHQLSESFGSDLPVLHLYSDRGGEFSSDLLRAFCRYTLSETTPTPRWTGKVGNASVFCVWGSRAFVRDASADKLSSRAIPCVFLGFPPDEPGWQFYHPTSRHVLSSQDVTTGAPPVDPLPPQGPAPSGVSHVDPVEPVEVAVDSSAARGAEPAGAGIGGAEPGVAMSEGAEPGGAEPERVEPGGAEPGGAGSGDAESGGAESERAESGGPPGVPSRREPLSWQRLREWYARRCSRAARATGPAARGAFGAGAAGGAAGAGAAGGAS